MVLLNLRRLYQFMHMPAQKIRACIGAAGTNQIKSLRAGRLFRDRAKSGLEGVGYRFQRDKDAI